MKTVLGIFQEREKIDNYLRHRGISVHDDCQIGPFSSRSQALEWMNYLESRLAPQAVERLIVGHLYPNIWYGTVLAVEE